MMLELIPPRAVIVLLLFLSNLSSFSNGSILSSPDMDTIAGPVKSVRFEESWYISQDGKRIPEKRYLTSVCSFSDKAQFNERLFFDGEGNIKGRWIRKYDSKDRVILEAKYKNEDRLITRVEYQYGESENPAQKLIYRYDGLLDKRLEFKYNGDGKVGEAHCFSKDGFQRKTVYTYDDKGNKTVSADYGADGNLLVKEEYYYNGQGHLVQVGIFNNENQLMATMDYIRDEQGREIDVFSHTRKGRQEMRRLYEYNSHDDITGLTSYGRDEKFFDREVYSYEYDRYGNWIEKHDWSARLDSNYTLPLRVLYRTITYSEAPGN